MTEILGRETGTQLRTKRRAESEWERDEKRGRS